MKQQRDTGRTPTAADVARVAGVSKSAVSRAFTRGASVAPATRQLVQDAAEALGYRPNPIARSLSTKRSAIIGVALSYMDQIYAPLLTRLSERLTQEGFRLLLFKADPDKVADESLEAIVHYNVDALILGSVKLSDAFAARCQRDGIPIVQINPTVDAHPLSSITAANHDGALALGNFLLAGGHRRFAFMAGFDGSCTSDARRTGFVEALNAAGIPLALYDVGDYVFEGGLLAARRLLAARDRPDAIFCANDSMACATIDVARREFGIAVGSALSVVGFDDERMAAWPGFSVTTYMLPIALLVDEVINLLRRMWANAGHTEAVIVPGKLIVRGSARLPPTG